MKEKARWNQWERLRFFGHRTMGRFTNERNLWYETPDEVKAGLEWTKERARLLRWVRVQIQRRLTPRERECVELYFFEGLTFRQAGEILGLSPSSVHRAVRRSVKRLRRAAAAQDRYEVGEDEDGED